MLFVCVVRFCFVVYYVVLPGLVVCLRFTVVLFSSYIASLPVWDGFYC